MYICVCDSGGKESTCNVGGPGSILDWEDPLEKRMATHSSILAWRIPRIEESGGLHSMGSNKSQTRLSDSKATVNLTVVNYICVLILFTVCKTH